MTGSCLCGAVRYAIEPPSLFCCHCHCRWCRRAHGAAFVTWLGAAEDRFRLEDAGAVRWYRSSEQSERGFCTTCGTTVFFRSTLCPGEVHVALATLDGPPDREPGAHVFFDAHVPWVALADDLPRIGADHPGLRKYAAVPPPGGRAQ